MYTEHLKYKVRAVHGSPRGLFVLNITIDKDTLFHIMMGKLCICVTVLLEWTQKHNSDRSNKDECL